MIKKYCVARIQYKQDIDTEIWETRFESEADAVDWLARYSHDGSFREFIILPVYIFNEKYGG